MDVIKKFIESLSKKERFSMIAILILILIASFFEMFSLALLFPYLSLLFESETNFKDIEWLYHILNNLSVFFNVSMVSFVTYSLIIFVFLSLLVRCFLNILLSRTIFNIGYKTSASIFSAYLRKPYIKHIEKSSDEISSSIIKIDNFLQVLNASLQALSAFTIGVFILFSVFFINFFVALFLSVYFLGLYLIIMAFTQAKLTKNGEQLNINLNKRTKSIIESSRGVKEIILSASYDFFLNRYNSFEREYRNAQISNHIIAPLPRLFLESIAITTIVAVSYFFYSSDLEITQLLPAFAVAIIAFQRSLPMFQQSYHGWVMFRGHQDIIDSVTEELSLSIKLNNDFKNKALKSKNRIDFNNKIELKDVSFSFSNDKSLFSNLNLTIKKGQRIGIVGESGSGKTTLINIIAGLMPINSGSILVDGKEIHDEDNSIWRKNISYLPQNAFLFDDDLKNNIALGSHQKDFNNIKIRESLKNAALDIFLENDIFQSFYLGEDGNRVSGGQKQRIALARAFYKSSDILILDEPSSALDKKTELKVFDSIFKGYPNITIIFISHSENFLGFCDHIYELKNKELIQNK